MARGGYRKPANPASVSGPGALSRRTDGKQPVMNITGGKYGENKQLNELQRSAPMAQAKTPQRLPAQPQQRQQPQKVTPLFAPTERPAEATTAGMPFGEGTNSMDNISISPPTLKETLLKALQTSNDPDLEIAYHQLQMRGEI